ncbi:heme ABC exporter ATP-binding protein CcmA [Deinococcus peraridilitoris]|uniref:Heme ABC exporter, ATP-binding protein CcmA n=1 Tax=Deinococcus peraridilitoris (strain DSM 19664 / LMG 22246 / CIP 109416 / KR-200) TaxID=937777 RepID=L0A025_DEIPD|nr:heme ABC exporter ATP-binding protein CcmA [Deinococcus peraridilitoris]AFZ66370.1 heme ABC exporter, ATP-binding protein CcmA [Deinococcus peraridilitoris DSM 19664]
MPAPVTPAPWTPQPAVQLRGLWLRLGRDLVLRDLDLDVGQGEGVALLGENGAGKTTLLRLLASAIGPTRGDGRIFGYDLRDRRAVREHVHLLSHESGLYPDLTPSENLRFALRMHRQEGDVPGVLGRLHLSGAAHKRVRHLSAGMRKRLALARLLMLRRPLLLIDEPFANLDAAGRELALEVLGEVRAAGSTLIVAAHEPELTARVTNRTLHLAQGKLSETQR